MSDSAPLPFVLLFVVAIVLGIIVSVHNLNAHAECNKHGGSYLKSEYDLPWGYTCVGADK